MKNVFHTLTLTVVAGGALLLSGCDANNPSPNQSGTGSITGQITPENAVYIVTVSSNANRTFSKQTNPVAGAYSFTNLADGAYTITYTAGTGYNTPAAQVVTVSGGGATTAPPVTVTAVGSNPGGTGGTGSTGGGTNAFAVDGGASTAASTATARDLAGSLTVLLGSASGSSVSIMLGGFTNAAGTYPLSGASLLSYSVTSGTNIQQWATTGSGGTGSVTITAVGTNPRTVSGTFTATAVAGQGATGTKTITGSFSNLAY